VRVQLKVTHGILPRVIQRDVDQQWSTNRLLKHATMHAQPFCLDDGVQLDEGVGACSWKHGPANRQAVHEDSDTSLLGGFDVKANLYLYLYTCGTRSLW
jgi:hypothetical protein